LAVAIVVGLALPASPLFARCGVERWAVKTGTDVDAAAVDLSSTTPTDVGTLRSLQPPSPLPANSRIAPTELTVWVVTATLTVFKLETDQDYHLVLTDASGSTMIVEIPDPACVGPGSPFASAIAQARAKFDAQLTATPQFQEVSIPVRVTGVGFFDFLHGQRGVAPNGIELHPVLDIVFNAARGGGDFTVSASPQTVGVSAGGTATLSVTTAASSGFSDAVAVLFAVLSAGDSVWRFSTNSLYNEDAVNSFSHTSGSLSARRS
jgi:hypothetical protein